MVVEIQACMLHSENLDKNKDAYRRNDCKQRDQDECIPADLSRRTKVTKMDKHWRSFYVSSSTFFKINRMYLAPVSL